MSQMTATGENWLQTGWRNVTNWWDNLIASNSDAPQSYRYTSDYMNAKRDLLSRPTNDEWLSHIGENQTHPGQHQALAGMVASATAAQQSRIDRVPWSKANQAAAKAKGGRSAADNIEYENILPRQEAGVPEDAASLGSAIGRIAASGGKDIGAWFEGAFSLLDLADQGLDKFSKAQQQYYMLKDAATDRRRRAEDLRKGRHRNRRGNTRATGGRTKVNTQRRDNRGKNTKFRNRKP